jgi:hypothetical protein
MKKNLSIEIYFKPEMYLPLPYCIEQIEQILKIQHDYMHKSQDWYLCGSSKKKSSIYKLFDKEGVTHIGLEKLSKEYQKDRGNYFSEAIWDKETEEASLLYILSNESTEQQKRFKIHIKLNFDLLLSEMQVEPIQNFINALAKLFNDAYIMVNGKYTRELRVFPDRLSAGWMLYLPQAELTHETVPESFNVISVTHQDKVTGSLVVTTPHFFDEENIDDIKKVNRVDIRLRDLGILPLYADM